MGVLAENQGFLLAAKEDAVTSSRPAGTYKAPVAGDAVQILSDGLEFTPAREIIERDIRTPTIEPTPGRTTTRSVTGSVPVELRANSAEGGAPEADKFYENLFGGKRQRLSSTLQTATSQSAVQSSERKTKFAVDSGDRTLFVVGDALRIFKAGVIDHVSAIKAVNDQIIEIATPAPVDIPGDSDISPTSTYFIDPNRADARYLSLTQYLGAKLEERAMGCRCTTGELSNFQTGQLPQFSFGFEGLDFDRRVPTPQELSAASALVNYQASLPPIILGAKVFQDDVELELNNIGITITNSLGFKTTTSSERGRVSSRVTDLEVAFTMNPYQDDENVRNFDLFKQNSPFSVFGFAANKTAAGKLDQICTFYMPNCRVNEIATGSEDGLLTDELSCMAYIGSRNDTIFLGFL